MCIRDRVYSFIMIIVCLFIGRTKVVMTAIVTLKLHEHKVPYFNHLGMIVVDEITAGDFGTFFCRTEVDVDFRTRSARDVYKRQGLAQLCHYGVIVVPTAWHSRATKW